MRNRLTEGLSLSSEPAGGLASPSGEWKSGRWSSRSLPSYELHEELRLSAGERPRTSCRPEPCCSCWGGKPDGVTRSRGGDMGSDLMFMLWLVLIERLEPWGRWPPPLRREDMHVFLWFQMRQNKCEKAEICRCVIQRDITEHSGCCFYVRASRECAFVWKSVTHTKELRAAWPSWCCCHADMEPSESPGELKPCREGISALLREYSVKTKDDTHTAHELHRKRALTDRVFITSTAERGQRAHSPAGL